VAGSRDVEGRPGVPTDEVARGGVMVSWIVIGVLYVLGMGFFRWLGGIGAASDAIASWGRSTAEKRRHSLPSLRS
jgi:hypothetical protein